MPRFDNEIRITPSVLDRLIDNEPEVSREPPLSRSKSVRLLKQSVKRDLERLLNTRQLPDDVPADLKELNKSVLMFGLPDFSNASIRNASDVLQLRRALETALARFEPRLDDIVVSADPAPRADRAVRFRISAQLRIDPAPEPITFDTVLQLSSGAVDVEGE